MLTYRSLSRPGKILGPYDMDDMIGFPPTIIITTLFNIHPIFNLVFGFALAEVLRRVKKGQESGILSHFFYAYLGYFFKEYLPPVKISQRYSCYRFINKAQRRIFNAKRRP